ncbi:MAG: hypothetical protein HWN66_14815 [Candidatus Helarchaeota archaeon]|nr:hypothetical protein [Candidatus Helarchaeota archaeon]
MTVLWNQIIKPLVNIFIKEYQPTKTQATFIGLLFFIVVVLALFFVIRLLFRKVFGFTLIDLYYFFKLMVDRYRGEEKRISALINWRNRRDYRQKVFGYDRVKVVRVTAVEEEGFDEEIFKKKTILVLKQAINKENKSDNLVKTVSLSIIHGYLAPVKEYIDEDLATAINNAEIEEKLRKMRAHKGRRDFISKKVTNQNIEELTEKICNLRVENLYNNVLAPYLLQLEGRPRTDIKEIKRDILELIDWLCDYTRRLVQCTTSRFFPKTMFLYVRLPYKELYCHINRAIMNFERVGCDVLVVSGWKKDKKEVIKVSRVLAKIFKFAAIREFWGEKEWPVQEARYDKRLSIIQLRNEELKALWE